MQGKQIGIYTILVLSILGVLTYMSILASQVITQKLVEMEEPLMKLALHVIIVIADNLLHTFNLLGVI